MCGIVGCVLHYNGGLISQTEDSFYQMLYADALRGFDSTGVIGVERNGAFHIAKEASEASVFAPKFKSSKEGRILWNEAKAMIGHNRKKTSGAIRDETAHPFVVDDTFALVHNGTLFSHKHLADTEVDSEALAIVLKKVFEEDDYIDALEETLGKVYGAYALAFYNQKKDKIHLLRNKERPLNIIKVDNASFFASEAGMAIWILNRNGYPLDKMKIEEVPVDCLVTYDLLKSEWSKENITPKKYQMSSTKPTMSASVDGGVGSGVKVVPKMVKFIKRKLLGTRCSFWVDDYVEVNCPKTLEDDGETEIIMFAETDDLKWQHSLTATVDLKDFGFSTREQIEDHRWSGVIEDITFNESTNSLLIDVTNCKPVTQSVVPREQQATRDFFRNELLKKSLPVLRKEYDSWGDHLVGWQKDTYEQLIKEKEKLHGNLEALFYAAGREAAEEEAKKEGVLLTREVRDGKEFLVHPTKGIVYESPIVVH